MPLGRVDDLELVHLDDGSLAVVGLLVGPQACGRRMGSRFGGAVEQLTRRLRNGAGPVRIVIRDVAGMDPSVRLRTSAGSHPSLTSSERTTRNLFIGRIPGSHSESE